MRVDSALEPFTVLLRCYGPGTDKLIDRKQELVTMVSLHQLNYTPPLYARFDNGYCYGFVRGKVMDVQALRIKENAMMVARSLARWHRQEIPCDPPNIWQLIERWISLGISFTRSLMVSSARILTHQIIATPTLREKSFPSAFLHPRVPHRFLS